MGRTADLPRRGEAPRLRLARHHGADAWEWLQREEHLFGAFEISHYRPKERQNSVCVVHPKAGEEAWRPLFDETGEALFPELMPGLDAIKAGMISGLVFRRDRPHRKRRALLPWKAKGGALDYLRATMKEIMRSAGLREELSFTSSRHGALPRARIPISAMPNCAPLAGRKAFGEGSGVVRAFARLHAWIDHEAAKKQPPARTKPADLSE